MRQGTDVPTIHREDVIVREEGDSGRDQVIDWTLAQGDRAGLELMILLDDSSNTSLGSQLSDIRAFINQQPSTTLIAVGYMRNGTVAMRQGFTEDHAAAARSLRLPAGIAGGSPYFSLTDFIKHWSATRARPRREVVLLSNGIEPYLDEIGSNPYVNEAIEDAQEAGIIVFTIYTPGVAEYDRNLPQMNWGQNYLTQLAAETGGESFMLGFEAQVSLAPYLDQVNRSLKNQYLLTFLPKAPENAGMRSIRVTTEVPNVKLITPAKIYFAETTSP